MDAKFFGGTPSAFWQRETSKIFLFRIPSVTLQGNRELQKPCRRSFLGVNRMLSTSFLFTGSPWRRNALLAPWHYLYRLT
jgi:hypothetical protein